jgi:dUTPase
LCALIYCPWPRIVRHGQRIAQMWPLAVDRQAFCLRQEAPADCVAGKQGFGSTGK